MPDFKYKAITASGTKIEGIHTANRKDEVIEMIRQNKQYPVSVDEVVEAGREISFFDMFNKVKTKDIAVFCRQFFTMLNAGVTIINCLDILRFQTENKKLRLIIGEMYEDVQKGMLLSESLEKKNNVFPDLLINMVAAGEVSGNLDTIMDRLSTHFEKENRILSKVKSAMIYPSVLAALAITVVVFLLTFVMPTFVSMFESGGVALPLPTRILLGISKGITQYGIIILIAIAGAVFYIRILLKTENGRFIVDNIRLKIPVVKGTTQKVFTSRFTRTLSTLMSSGIPLIQALEVVSKVVGNKVVEKGIIQAIEEVKKGVSLSIPIKKMNLFPPMVYYMLSIGEESGALDDILNRTANYYDDEVETSLQKLTALMEPLMIIVMAVVVGAIAVAMVMPMFDMINTVQM